MSNKARQQTRVTLNDAMNFVSSQVVTRNITGQSVAELIEEELKRIEGEVDGDVVGTNRRPRVGQIARIRAIREELSQLVDTLVANPGLLDAEQPLNLDPNRTVQASFRA